MSQSKQVVVASLEAQRAHVLGCLEGLTDQQLRQPVLPSGWSCLGLLNHLAVDVERFWFRAVVAGQQDVWVAFEDATSAWEVDVATPSAEVVARYHDEVARANEVIGSTAMDAAPATWPEEMFGAFRLPDLTSVLLHVITETACHAGHLDAAREILDGRQWMVL